MNGNIDQFREDLLSNISGIVASFDRFNALVSQGTTGSEQELREQLIKLEETAEQSRGRATVAHMDFARWMEEEKSDAIEKVADWKQKRLTGRLHARADRLEQCATTALEIALLAMCEAERNVLRALLARQEAISIQVQRINEV